MTPSQRLHPDLVAVLKTLKLGKLVPGLPDRLRLASENGLDHEDVLLLVLSDEAQRRANMRVQNRSREAGLQPTQVFEEWDNAAHVEYDRGLLERLRTLRFLDEHAHILLMGPVGVGKTMLAQAFAGHVSTTPIVPSSADWSASICSSSTTSPCAP